MLRGFYNFPPGCMDSKIFISEKKFPPVTKGELLGKWVDKQHTEKKKFDKDPTTSQLTQERIDKLNKVGFAWNPGKGKGGGGNRRKSLRQ